MSRAARIFSIAMIGGLFAVSVYAGVVSQQQTQAMDAAGAVPTASNQFAILVTTIAGFASLLATHLFQYFRETRNRKWDLADRSSARQEMRQHVETQRVETIQAAIELARVSNINRDHLTEAISRNTTLTSEAAAKADAAYNAANDFNGKIERLHAELVKLQKVSASTKG